MLQQPLRPPLLYLLLIAALSACSTNGLHGPRGSFIQQIRSLDQPRPVQPAQFALTGFMRDSEDALSVNLLADSRQVQHDRPADASSPAADSASATDPGESLTMPAGRASSEREETPSDEYRLGPGDQLEFIYQFINREKAQPYRIRPRDQIELNFLQTPDYNRTLVVRTDGEVSLPLVGTIEATGKTLDELKEEIRAKYSQQLEEPQIDLYAAYYTTREDELKEAIYTSSEGYRQQMPVRPDGNISLPEIGSVIAAGRTLKELGAAIDEQYAAAGMPNVEVSVVLRSAASSLAYIMGEVPGQGPIHLRGPIGAWRAIAEAGGFGPDADRRHVLVARSTSEGEKRYVINFDAWRVRSDGGEDVQIQPGDVIYIPRASKRFVYIAGEIERPGRVELDQDSEITVSQVVAMGGGVTSRGTRDQALLLQSTSTNQPIVVPVNLRAIWDPGKAAEDEETVLQAYDPLVQPGDIVYVPSSPVGDFNRFAQQWFREGIWTVLPFSAFVSYQEGNFDTAP